jgi:predicted TPR repeat methyltransferase
LQSRQIPALASSFQHAGMVAAHIHRPPYPDDVFDTLETLIVDRPRHVLDLGAGDDALARPLAARLDRVDAVEISQAMVDAGRRSGHRTHAGCCFPV